MIRISLRTTPNRDNQRVSAWCFILLLVHILRYQVLFFSPCDTLSSQCQSPYFRFLTQVPFEFEQTKSTRSLSKYGCCLSSLHVCPLPTASGHSVVRLYVMGKNKGSHFIFGDITEAFYWIFAACPVNTLSFKEELFRSRQLVISTFKTTA